MPGCDRYVAKRGEGVMKSINDYKKLAYKVILEYRSQDQVHVARFPELPGCIAHGDTPQSALDYALKVKDDWLETAFESGWPIPEPSEVPETSGRITVRTPKYMHKQLIDRAEEEGISLNQLILSFIGQGLERTIQEHVLKEVSVKQDKLIDLLAERQIAEEAKPRYVVYVPQTAVGTGKVWQFADTMLRRSVANSVSNILTTSASAGTATAGTCFPSLLEEEEKELAPLAKVPTFNEYGKNYQTGGCLYET
jgi:antitoxin HicB